jgi:hypothetical protein
VEPRRSPLAPSLERWSRSAAASEQRTVIVRFGPSVEVEHAAEELRNRGAAVQQVGAATVSCRVTPPTLRELAVVPWILAVEEPRRLFPAGPAG